MSDFNRGTTGPGRRRSLGLMPGESAGEGVTGNVIPRGTTQASVRRGQALLRMMNDRLPTGQQFSRGTTRSGRRRNFAMMAGLQDAAVDTGVKLTMVSQSVSMLTPIAWVTEVYDYEGWWTSGSTLTCPVDGTYDVSYAFTVTQSVPGSFTVIITKNGGSVDSVTHSAGTTPISRTASVAMVVGDTIVVQVSGPFFGTTFTLGEIVIS